MGEVPSGTPSSSARSMVSMPLISASTSLVSTASLLFASAALLRDFEERRDRDLDGLPPSSSSLARIASA